MNIKGFHLELTNICTLKCSGCARTQLQAIFPQHWKNHSIDKNSLMNFLDIDVKDMLFILCGNYGDPIYHPEFLEIVKLLKQRNAKLEIVTNGSYKTKEWWERLTDLLDKDDLVVFSVDGTPKNFTIYRENADWESIEVGMRVVANCVCDSKWTYIPFNYNENNIQEVEELSKQIGIKRFEVRPSDRFDEYTEHLIPVNDLIGPRQDNKTNWKQGTEISKVYPKCNSGIQHFITSDGYYSPCCFANDFRFYYKTPFGLDKERFDIRNKTITEILNDQTTLDFMNNLEDHTVCQFNCNV